MKGLHLKTHREGIFLLHDSMLLLGRMKKKPHNVWHSLTFLKKAQTFFRSVGVQWVNCANSKHVDQNVSTHLPPTHVTVQQACSQKRLHPWKGPLNGSSPNLSLLCLSYTNTWTSLLMSHYHLSHRWWWLQWPHGYCSPLQPGWKQLSELTEKSWSLNYYCGLEQLPAPSFSVPFILASELCAGPGTARKFTPALASR